MTRNDNSFSEEAEFESENFISIPYLTSKDFFSVFSGLPKYFFYVSSVASNYFITTLC